MEKMVSLRENYEFRRAYARGKSFVSPFLVTYVFRTKKDAVRVGITTSKKIGNAVTRNRSRRVLREACRGLLPRIRPGVDLVLVARGRTAAAKSGQLACVLESQLREAGALREAKP